ncbi:MAG: PAS domain S-box protein, partial [Silvanigrellaceae bacterium]|nr:PAS domain S-box protein [Silvanigrellaceae bacterium]
MNNGDFDNIFNWVNKVVLISITDIFGNILLANDKFCETCGYLREELIGKNHRIIKSGYHSEDFYKELWNTIASGSVWRGEICNQRKDGSLYWVDSIITSIHNENNEKQYLSIRFDITLRKLLENEIQQTSKLSLLGEMVAETAHEILNPLFFVSNSLSQLPQLISEPNKFEKKIVTLKKNCKKIEKIVLGLKNYSHKKENKEYLQSSLYLIIEEALVIISDRLKMNEINLTVENNCLSPILCDALEIEQVIINL